MDLWNPESENSSPFKRTRLFRSHRHKIVRSISLRLKDVDVHLFELCALLYAQGETGPFILSSAVRALSIQCQISCNNGVASFMCSWF